MEPKNVSNIEVLELDGVYWLFCDFQDPESGEWNSWESKSYESLGALMNAINIALIEKGMLC